jgi:hypothetical protein
MSELMLHGKLNMPLPDDPQDCDVVTWVQFKAAAKEASDRIKELEDALEYGVDLIKGDAVGSEWKRRCSEFLRISRAAIKAIKGDKT